MNQDEIIAAIGDPTRLNANLQDFKRAARVFSSKKEHLIAKYCKQWVAAVDNKIVAHASNPQRLFAKLAEAGIPAENAMIRYIDVALRKLIL